MITAAQTVVARLEPHVQSKIVEQVRAVLREAPLVRPTTPGGAPMRVRVSAAGQLGWVGDGAYRYSPTQANGMPWPTIPVLWRVIADNAAGHHPWDSAIVNWYDPDAALGWHRDLAEADRSYPIVTLSLGDAASWAIAEDRATSSGEYAPGSKGERVPLWIGLSRTRLESGDVTLLAGDTRLHWHTIERIIPAPLLSPLGTTRGRISITLRVAGTFT